MSNFIKFKNAVAHQLAMMAKEGQLFTVKIDRSELWDFYLNSFPEGTNLIYKNRREYDCNCCKGFIKTIGAVVTIGKNGKLISLWDVKVDGYYQPVADALSKLIKTLPIDGPFFHAEHHIGTNRTHQLLPEGKSKVWEHFYAETPKACMMHKDMIATKIGEHRATFDVLKRSMEELTLDSAEVVLELIMQNSLYRGTEHKQAVQGFIAAKKKYDAAENKDRLLWAMAMEHGHAMRFRNTVIGTLLQDISAGVDLEVAVKSFETKVAPSNYKRSTALVTQGMIDSAKKTVSELGLEDSLFRRFAVAGDLTINNLLFVDRSVKPAMNVFDEFLSPTKPKTYDRVEDVSVDKFLANVLPTATSVEVLLENKHTANLVSLVAPVYQESPRLFKWDNGFSWSYNGDIADSDIRAAVQARGGRVDGVFRFSHSWNYNERNASLMDLHVFMPGSNHKSEDGAHDQYGNNERVGWNRRQHPGSGGSQDVDYTDAAPAGYVPVENITFPSMDRLKDGKYVCKIHNWQHRIPTAGGFRAEIEFDGQLFEYEVKRPLKHKEWVTVATVTLSKGVFSIEHHLPCSASTKEVWGVSTGTFHKVSMVLNSPNHWDGNAVGNKHLFFILDGCVNPEKARGFYNEFLKTELIPHRKVFEVLGSKMKTAESQEQLSGIGFSDTKRDSVTVKVVGKTSRVMKINF